NVGPAMAADLRLLGIHAPQQLKGRDGLQLYRKLCEVTGQRHDPCVLDTMLAVVDFMHGAPPAPWWAYTPQRKAMVGQARDWGAGAPPRGRDGNRASMSATPLCRMATCRMPMRKSASGIARARSWMPTSRFPM